MKSLHICFVSQEYPPETGWGGIGAYTYEMAHALAKMGHRVTVISLSIDENESVMHTGDVEVRRIHARPRLEKKRFFWRWSGLWPGFSWAACRYLKKLHQENPIDLIEVAENRADLFFLSFYSQRPKWVTRLHTAWIFVDQDGNGLPNFKKRMMYWMEKQTIRNADAITSPSQAMVDRTKQWVCLKHKKTWVVPNPVDSHRFVPNSESKKSKEIFFVGRLEKRKGIGLFVEIVPRVLRKFPEASFRFIGKSSEKWNGTLWKELILNSVLPLQQKQIHFEQLRREELLPRYQNASLCVMPSIWENFPYAVLEAMSCGLPVVASRIGGHPELIQDGFNAVLFPPGDAELLSKAIIELLQNPEKMERMGRNARQVVEENFSVEHVAPRMLEVYREILAA